MKSVNFSLGRRKQFSLLKYREIYVKTQMRTKLVSTLQFKYWSVALFSSCLLYIVCGLCFGSFQNLWGAWCTQLRHCSSNDLALSCSFPGTIPHPDIFLARMVEYRSVLNVGVYYPIGSAWSAMSRIRSSCSHRSELLPRRLPAPHLVHLWLHHETKIQAKMNLLSTWACCCLQFWLQLCLNA